VALRNATNNFTAGQNTFTGNVGIGLSVPPGAPLDIFGTMRVANSAGQFSYVGFPAGSSQTAILGQFLTSDTNYPQLRFSRLMGGNLMDIGQDGNGNFGVFGNTVERLTVQAGGNVGIGTTTPANLLDVQGSADFSGNVGIGTTTPRHKLDVNGNIFLGTQRNGQIFNEIGDTLYLGAEQKYLGNTLLSPVNGSTDWINLMANPISAGIMFGLAGPTTTNPHTNTTPLMIIQSNGNVGIGTTNATSQLTVNGFGSPAISLIGNGNSAGGQLDFGIAGFATAFSVSAVASDAVIRQSGKGKLFLQTGSGTAAITIATNNNVGIGTSTPTNTLQVNGTVAASALRAPGAGINSGTFAFTQRAVSSNTSANQTFISNPVCDGDPNAILIVTHNWTADTNSTSQYNTKPVGVYYTGANWSIFNEDGSAMALGRAFNVMVIKP
jgi:hypothetical protein